MRKVFWAREITVDTAFRACAAMGTYLSTHAIASQAQSRCLNGNLTRLDSAATPRAVFLNLVTVNRKYYTKLAVARFGIVKKKGRCPLRRFATQITPIPRIYSLIKSRELEGRDPLERACQTAVQTLALGKNCDGVRTKSTYPLQFLPRNSVSTVVSQARFADG